jgi:hypothetical protein
MSEISFVPDENIQKIAMAYAFDAVEFAWDRFQVMLDWSDSSIQHVETLLQRFHQELPKAKPSEEKILQFSKMFGSYIGEVFRNNHGGYWGMVTLGDEPFPGIRAMNRSKGLFWPWARVRNRIVNGIEDNVWHSYQSLVERFGRRVQASAVSAKPKRKNVKKTARPRGKNK